MAKHYVFTGFILVISLLSIAIAGEQQFQVVKNVEHRVVYHQQGRFGGWPANNYAWQFQDGSMLVGFTEGPYKFDPKSHNIGKPQMAWLARSNDGGQTWKAYDPEDYVNDFGQTPQLKTLKEPIQFTTKDFAMRIVGTGYHVAYDLRGHFFYSYDGGRNWKGPYGFGNLLNHPELKKYNMEELTPRTDYVVMGKYECLIMMSARPKGPSEFGADKLFCVRTIDGGQSFEFLGWIVPPFHDGLDQSEKVPLYDDSTRNPHPSQCRAVMPQTLKLANGKLVTVMRRRYKTENWIDAYASVDGGKAWTYQSWVGGTGSGNGNPPALNMTADRRLCAVFGERKKARLMVSYSSDEGKTWTEQQVLRDDFGSEDMQTSDMGYPRLLRRDDGKMVAVYYYSTKECLHHIAATIWDPAK